MSNSSTASGAAGSGQVTNGALPPGAIAFALLTAEHPEQHAGLTAIGREIAYTLRRAVEYMEEGARAEPDPGLLLRAGRSAWLVGELELACDAYRAAVPQLVAMVDAMGRRSGTAAEHLRLALGAAWMAANRTPDEKRRAADVTALRALIRQTHDLAQRLATTSSHALERLALDVLRVRAGWMANDMELPRLMIAAQRRADALDVHSKAAWSIERDKFVMTAIQTIVEERPDRHAAPLGEVDRYFGQHVHQPASVTDLMDEELIALQAAATKRGAKLSPLRHAPLPGSRVDDLAPLLADA